MVEEPITQPRWWKLTRVPPPWLRAALLIVHICCGCEIIPLTMADAELEEQLKERGYEIGSSALSDKGMILRRINGNLCSVLMPLTRRPVRQR